MKKLTSAAQEKADVLSAKDLSGREFVVFIDAEMPWMLLRMHDGVYSQYGYGMNREYGFASVFRPWAEPRFLSVSFCGASSMAAKEREVWVFENRVELWYWIKGTINA